MNVPPQIIELLQALNSGVTEKIKAGEELYAKLKLEQPNDLVRSFVILMRQSQDELLRSYPPVLLRTLVNQDGSGNVLASLNNETIEFLKLQLMLAVKEEPKNFIRHSILNVIAILAIQLIPKQQWKEILLFINESSASAEESQRESAFFLIGLIIEDKDVALFLQNHFHEFATLVSKGLNDPSIKVQVAALETISSFIEADAEKAKVFQPLVPAMLKTIQRSIEANMEKEAQKGMLAFIIIAQFHSVWLIPNFDTIFKVFYGFLESSTLEDETRHTCLHFFLTFAECKPSTMKKSDYIQPLVLLLLKWMSTVEDIELPEWNAMDTEPTEDDDSNVAFEAIEGLSHYVSKGLWDFFLSTCAAKLLGSQNWKERYTCLMALSSISEGCEKQIKQNFKPIVQNILPLANDPHPRVRFALFYCLSSFASTLKKEVQDLFKTLIPVALEHLVDQSPRVIIADCEFLTLFLDEIKPSRVKEYKNQFLEKLSPLLQNSSYKIVQHSLNAFSSVVDGIGEEFTQHYSEIMPFLINILKTQTSVETKTLRGRAIETISLIGLAVGKKVFINDCAAIIQYVSTLEKFTDDDPQVDFFLRAFTRFAQCLGEDFVPYLSYAMVPLVDAINGKVDASIVETEDNYTNDSVSQSGNIIMENKAMALEMVSIYAMELKHHLFPYIPKLYSGSIELIDFQFNSLVSMQAVNLIPFLIKIAKSYFETNGFNNAPVTNGLQVEFTQKLFMDSFTKMIESIKTETEPETLSAKLKSLADLIDIGSGYDVTTILNLTFAAITETFTSLQEMESEYRECVDEEDDEADDSVEREILDDAYNSLAMVLGEVCIQYKLDSVKYIVTVLPTMVELIENAPSVEIKTSMICILDDLIENGGREAFQLYTHIIKPMIACAVPGGDPSLIQSAVFGIGLAAENGKEYFAPYLIESLTVLDSVIRTDAGDDADMIGARDNAISAMGRIISSIPQHLGSNLPQLINVWLGHLPIQDDGEAASIIKSLTILLRDFTAQLLPHMVKVLQILAVGLHKKVVGDEEKQIIFAVFSQNQSSVAQSLQSLAPESQQLIQGFFQ